MTPPAKRAFAGELPASIASAAWEFIDGPLRDNPQRVGRRLRPPFAGSWSARRGTYRVRYRIDESRHAVTVLDIIGRADADYPSELRPSKPARPRHAPSSDSCTASWASWTESSIR